MVAPASAEDENKPPRKLKTFNGFDCKKPTLTASRINSFFRQCTGLVISGRTIRKRLPRSNLIARRQATNLRLPAPQRGRTDLLALVHQTMMIVLVLIKQAL